MKKTTFLLLALLCAIASVAQPPQAFKYQAVARDNGGNILNNQLVSFRISILQGSATGTSVYSETHQPTTNDFGLANVEIGTGSVVSGSFVSIDWSTGSYFLKVELDATGGTTYALTGTSQLLSVPYALYSGSTANPDDNDWTISGDNMYSTVAGNVGIGTATPIAELEVAGHISTSSTGNSVFLGWGAGYYDDLSNNYNVFIGQSSGNLNTTGNNNTACGSYSLFSSEGGAYNTVIGQKSLYYNVSGNNNTAIGNQAGHGLYGGSVNGCVFLGNKAGYYNGTDNRLFIENSDSNTPLIYGEFDNDIVGINGNLGVGTSNPGANLEVFDASGQADIRITRPSSTYAAALSFYTGSTDEWTMANASGSKNLLIHRGPGNTTGNLGLMYNGGNVGIGTSSPAVKAHIVGGTDASLTGGGYLLTGSTTGQNIVLDENEIMARNNGATSTLHLQRNGGGLSLHYDQSDYDQFNINSSGWTGIGVTSPNSKLHVNTSGDDGLRVQIYTNTKFLVHSNGGVVAGYNVATPTFAFQLQNNSIDLLGRGRAYSWNTYSDSRLKSNQRQIEYGLKEVMKLQPKSYMHHSSSTSEEGDFVMITDHKISTVGFIAQEVQQIIPEAVCEPLDESKDLWSMDYDKLIPVLTKAIQEQQAMIVDQNSVIEQLLSRIDALESK